jgi:hypothetical protein
MTPVAIMTASTRVPRVLLPFDNRYSIKLDRKTFVTTPEANTAATFERDIIQIILCPRNVRKKTPQVSTAKFILRAEEG